MTLIEVKAGEVAGILENWGYRVVNYIAYGRYAIYFLKEHAGEDLESELNTVFTLESLPFQALVVNEWWGGRVEVYQPP